MKRTPVLQAICALLSLLLCSACAAPVTAPNASLPQGEERVLSDVRVQYRNASLVVAGVCEGIHTDANGETCYDVLVSEVYAGSAEVGDLLHCPGRVMQEGEEYLLFLTEGADTNYAEDTIGYELLSDTPLSITENGEIVWDGKRLPMRMFREEVAELQKTISAPAPVYYYDDLRSMVEAADEIFIGRVHELTDMASCSFVTRNGGNVEKAQHEACFVTVEAFGPIKGVFTYGKEVTLVYSPERAAGMLDASTLLPSSVSAKDAIALEKDGIYVFFLISTPDSKQKYFFPINPVQGFAALEGEALYSSAGNTPLKRFSSLTELVVALQGITSEANAYEEAPPLVIEE